jgi:uncharacterized protein YuzE
LKSTACPPNRGQAKLRAVKTARLRNRNERWTALVGLGLVFARLAVADAQALELVPLEIQTPIPAFIGTPPDIPEGEHIEKPSDNPRPPFLAPQGTRNIALHKPVTLSNPNPISGSAELVTDGNKEAGDESMVELRRRLQWVQIDLQKQHKIYAIVIWHAHDELQIVHDVIVQVADDADFTQNVRTLFNNDYDNSAGMGVGNNKEYFENYEGRLIDAEGVVGRYVRSHSQGSTYTGLNRWTEIEVYGLPAE